ncbi:MAG TPA: hypothetical protein VK427_08870 [Kofleriaceae bacterium]|nr:hypothetical protein [Kofleriaceae bacterium]
MYSRFSILLASSFLFSALAFAGTQKVVRNNVTNGSSNVFPAKAGTPVTVKGTISPTDGRCLDVVPAVEMRLERRMVDPSDPTSIRFDLVTKRVVPLNGSVNETFTAQSNVDGAYKVTWSPMPNQSTSLVCKFNQDLEVTFTN